MRDQTKRVLIIGSDRILINLLCDVIQSERSDVIVETKETMPERYPVARQEPSDLLIVDGSMSGQDGLELISRVQTRCPKTGAVLITAADREEIHERQQRTMASFALFTKPFSIDAFLSHLDRVLGKANAGVSGSSRTRLSVLYPVLNWA